MKFFFGGGSLPSWFKWLQSNDFWILFLFFGSIFWPNLKKIFIPVNTQPIALKLHRDTSGYEDETCTVGE